MRRARTYWHLAGLGRKPSEYDIATSRLLYHPSRGYALDVPAAAWYRAHGAEVRLPAVDWEGFRDPRATTYSSYVECQDRKEAFLEGLYRLIEESGYDHALAPAWIATLGRLFAPLRYPAHAFGMAAAYVGHLAPASRIVIAALFQAADELRRVHALAYRMAQLRQTWPDFGADSAGLWHDDAVWQPLRRAVERLLVTYAWGESFVALNLAVKPAFDALLVEHLARLGDRSGDPLLGELLFSLGEDAAWHRAWSVALVRHIIEGEAANVAILRRWIDTWHPPALEAITPLASVLAAGLDGGPRSVVEAIDAACRSLWSEAGL